MPPTERSHRMKWNHLSLLIQLLKCLALAATVSCLQLHHYSAWAVGPRHAHWQKSQWAWPPAKSQLWQLDTQAASSSFGEPVFRLEPQPARVELKPERGLTLLCMAAGSPRPQISWFAAPLEEEEEGEEEEEEEDDEDFEQLEDDKQPDELARNRNNLKRQMWDRKLANSAGRLVKNITNFIYITNDGNALKLLPFHSTAAATAAAVATFRPELHRARYSCVASNQVASVRSRSVEVRTAAAVVEPEYALEPKLAANISGEQPAVRVHDEFVHLGASAVLSCRPPAPVAAGRQSVQLIEWFTSDSIQIRPGDLLWHKGAVKFAAFQSGELHVNQVEMADLRRTYGCRLRWRRSATEWRQVASSGLAKLILAQDELSGQSQRQAAGGQFEILHAPNRRIVIDLPPPKSSLGGRGIGDDPHRRLTDQQLATAAAAVDLDHDEQKQRELTFLLLPCALRSATGRVAPNVRWFHQEHSRAPLVSIERLARLRNLQLNHWRHHSPNITSSTAATPTDPNNRSQQSSAGRILVTPTFLWLDTPPGREPLGGRFVAQLETETRSDDLDNEVADDSSSSSRDTNRKFVCDTKVILRERLRVTLEVSVATVESRGGGGGELASSPPAPLQWTSDATDQVTESSWRHWLATILHPNQQITRVRNRRHLMVAAAAEDRRHLRARVAGSDTPPYGSHPSATLAREGDRLEASCRVEGRPVGKLRWFADGRALDGSQMAPLRLLESRVERTASSATLVSSLLVVGGGSGGGGGGDHEDKLERVQFAMLECFARNSLADSARAGRLVGVVSGGWAGQWDLCPDGELEEPTSSSSSSSGGSGSALQQTQAIEGQPLELACPWPSDASHQVDWFRLTRGADKTETSSSSSRSWDPEQWSQLVNGDSRYVINGSTVLIKSPSGRHDETIYACRRRLERPQEGGQQEEEQQRKELHQSSLAGAPLQQFPCAGGGALSWTRLRVSAKPKIDPFEFSRNLEEGMRAVAVCAVVSGSSPVQINWFRDGQLISSEQPELENVSVEQPNDFSSSLTFHRIQANHSAHYTCVASNSLGAQLHTSQLLVNVAPFFIEPPESQRVKLGSNVLVNCRAAGQPKWLKLILSQVPTLPPSDLTNLNLNLNLGGRQSAAAAAASSGGNQQEEFRIITSNSHIQVLENGSMIIKQVDLNDASRYVCQANNGINPSLSEVIEIKVLSPAQFEVDYETISVKRDATVKLNCNPRGDQPIRVVWLKEGVLLAPAGLPSQLGVAAARESKYTEVAKLALANSTNGSKQQQQGPAVRHSILVAVQQQQQQQQANSSDGGQLALRELENEVGVVASELQIRAADRTDSGAFVCRAENAHGRDQLTYRLLVQEPPDAPARLELTGLQSDSLRVAWPAPFDGNLPILHYNLEFRRLLGAGRSGHAQRPGQAAAADWNRVLVAAAASQPTADSQQKGAKAAAAAAPPQQQQQQFLLKQLEPRASYQIRVGAVNALGPSAGWSPVQTMSTAEDLPRVKPLEVRAQPISSRALRVTWRHANDEEAAGPVRGFYVSHRPLRSSDELLLELAASSEQTGADWLATQSVSSQQQQQQQQSASSFEFLIEGLERNSKYQVRVQPFNSQGTGPPADVVGQTFRFERPRRPELRLVASKRQAFELSWSAVGQQQQQQQQQTEDDELAPVSGFLLFYKCEYDDWQELKLGRIFHFILDNLRCGNKYQIYLSAFNLVGRSDPSDVLNVRTEGTAPLAPERDKFILHVNSTQVLLNISAWHSAGCPISSFVVQFKRLLDDNWFMLTDSTMTISSPLDGAAGANSTDRLVSIPNLSAGAWYKLQVAVANEAGKTEAEFVFGTLTSAGEPPAPPAANLDTNYAAENQLQASHSAADFMRQLADWLAALIPASRPSGGPTGRQTDGVPLLLPLSCVLLALVTLLAGYLYYAGRGPPTTRTTHSERQSHVRHRRHHSDHYQASGHQQHYSQTPADLLLLNKLAYHELEQPNGKLLLVQRPPADPLNGPQQQQQQLIYAPTKPQTQCFELPPEPQLTLASADSMLDTLIGQVGAGQHQLAGRVKYLASQQQQQQQSSASNSISTHSTNCPLGAADSQATGSSSSSASSSSSSQFGQSQSAVNFQSVGTRLQLIDEQQPADELAAACAEYSEHHVGLLPPAPTDLLSSFAGQPAACAQLNCPELMAQQQQQQQRRISTSSSFASAGELLHRSQPPDECEPIYQRLERNFKSPADSCRQFATLNARHWRPESSSITSCAPNFATIGRQLPPVDQFGAQFQGWSAASTDSAAAADFFPPPPPH